MTGDVSSGGDGAPVAEVSGAVAQWVEQVGRFLGVVQAALEQSRPKDDASAEVRAVAGQLPALIRQCRAQVPTPEMIHTWIQTLSEKREAESRCARIEGPEDRVATAALGTRCRA